jgi:hypothetical protein
MLVGDRLLAIDPGAFALARSVRLDGNTLFPAPFGRVRGGPVIGGWRRRLVRDTSISVLALDATALLALEQMTDVVPAVKYERPVRLQ